MSLPGTKLWLLPYPVRFSLVLLSGACPSVSPAYMRARNSELSSRFTCPVRVAPACGVCYCLRTCVRCISPFR